MERGRTKKERMGRINRRPASRQPNVRRILLWPLTLLDYTCQRLLLGISQRREIDSFSVYSVDGTQQFFKTATEAIALLRSKDPVRYERARRYMPVIAHVRQGFNFYKHAVRAFYVHEPSEDVPYFASEIVHEATHAYLQSRGYRYDHRSRKHHEQICTRQQLAFIMRVIQSQDHISPAQQEDLIRQWKEWFQQQLASEWWHERVTRQKQLGAIKELLLELRKKSP